jgi:NTE family protein
MWNRWARAVRNWAYQGRREAPAVRIGVALGGGFARVMTHVGVLEVLEENRIPIHAITGISSGAIIAAAYAGGSTIEQMKSTGAITTFSSYARWTLSKLGLAVNDRMVTYLPKILPCTRFEAMRVPLGVVATDLQTGRPVVFHGSGDIVDPIRASCAYPGFFLPVKIEGRWLVDGGISVNVPVEAAAELGATHVVAVYLRTEPDRNGRPENIFQVVSRCFAIMQDRLAMEWEDIPHLVVQPNVADFDWDDFDRVEEMVESGREAARAALPQIQEWLAPERPIRHGESPTVFVRAGES